MAGTDHTKPSVGGGPIVVLVRPQLAENIGMAARAMANFGLDRMRLVAPRGGWPKKGAREAASGAVHVLDGVELFDDLRSAVADCNLVFAATARERGQAKPVVGADAAAAGTAAALAAGERVAIVFGPERSGLDNDEVGLADRIISFPVNPAFASLNLAQAVLLVGYEWFKLAHGEAPVQFVPRSPQATREGLLSFFDYLTSELDEAGFFVPAEKRPIMVRNMLNIFHRLEMTDQDVRTLRGAVVALVLGRRGKRAMAAKPAEAPESAPKPPSGT
jgi:tRNA/rRNA methyltransferase